LTGEALYTVIAQLEAESRQDGIERKLLKRQRNKILQPLKQITDRADIQIREMKRKRKELSRQLQAQMHAAYSLINFYGRSQTLQQLMPQGLPTGTGDCCTPKLLHYAATHNLQPVAMAEFWWGASSKDKIQGEFYGACEERCQPLMGFLLSGLQSNTPINPEYITSVPRTGEVTIIYEDEWLIAVNKPSGLLSVPGRYSHNQDSVLSRLRNLLPDAANLLTVHRLDMDTSGILVLARNPQIHRLLNQQFQQRQIHKIYEAVLANSIYIDRGTIDLPLWGDPSNRPYQQVNWQYGKPSITKFRAIATKENYTRIEFIPITGRTHQLRVHAAHPQGLGVPILGDRLYGNHTSTDRLHLHARELYLQHPHTNQKLHLQTTTPF
jgi:tRNA pseudouridine32 synthase/23S rRNA pseudouridine746 synthase